MSRHPALAVPVTLWGGPLDGLKIRVNPAAKGLLLKDFSGQDVVYVPEGNRWVPARPEVTA